MAPAPNSTSVSPQTPPSPTVSAPPSISIINAAAFLRASKLPGSHSFRIHLSDVSNSASARKAKLEEDPVDLSNIPPEYHDFADVFSETQANNLAPHCPYNLKINLEEGASLPWGPIYSLFQSELQALHDFIEENLCSGFI